MRSPKRRRTVDSHVHQRNSQPFDPYRGEPVKALEMRRSGTNPAPYKYVHRRQDSGESNVTVTVQVSVTVDPSGNNVPVTTETLSTEALATDIITALPSVPSVPAFPSDLTVPSVPAVPSVEPVTLPVVPPYPFGAESTASVELTSTSTSIEGGFIGQLPSSAATLGTPASTAAPSVGTISPGYLSSNSSGDVAVAGILKSSTRSLLTLSATSSESNTASTSTTSSSFSSETETSTSSSSSFESEPTSSIQYAVTSQIGGTQTGYGNTNGGAAGGYATSTTTTPAAAIGTAASQSASSDDDGGPAPTPVIVGSTVGSIAGVVALLFVLGWLLKRHKRLRQRTNMQPLSGGDSMQEKPRGGAMLPVAFTNAIKSSTPPSSSERGFQRLSGRKLPSAFSPGMDSTEMFAAGANRRNPFADPPDFEKQDYFRGAKNAPRESYNSRSEFDKETLGGLDRESQLWSSQRSMHGPDLATTGVADFATYKEMGAALREVPARRPTIVTNHESPFGDHYEVPASPSSNYSLTPRIPQTPGTPHVDGIGRTRPSQDNSRVSSRFTENV